MSFAVTVRNVGNVAITQTFNTGFWPVRTDPPLLGQSPSASQAFSAGLAIGGQHTFHFELIAPSVGTYTTWAYVDRFDGISEINEMNNAGPEYFGYHWSVLEPVQAGYPSGNPATIPGRIEVENYDSGISGYAFYDRTAANEGGKYRTDAVDITQDGAASNGYVVGWTKAGEWLEYSIQVATAGAYEVEFRVAAVGTGGVFRLDIDSHSTGNLMVPNTGTWTNYHVVKSAALQLPAGVYTVRLVMVTTGASGNVGAFDTMRFLLPPLSGQQPFNQNYQPWPITSWIEVENYDYGGSGIAYQDSTVANEGGVYRTGDGVDIAAQTQASNGHAVGWTLAGEWLEYTVNVASNGTYRLEMRVANTGTGGVFRLLVNGEDHVGQIIVPLTGGWTTYQTVQKTGFQLSAGTHIMRLFMERLGVSGVVGAFDCWRLVRDGGIFGVSQMLPSQNGGGPIFYWGPLTNNTRMTFAPSLNSTNWTPITGWITGEQYTLPASPLGTSGFYRVEFRP